MRRAVEAVAVSVTPKRTISGTPKRMGTRCSMKMPSGGARGCTRGDAFSPGSASMESRKSDTRRALPCIDASDGRQTADVGSMIGVVRSAAAVNSVISVSSASKNGARIDGKSGMVSVLWSGSAIGPGRVPLALFRLNGRSAAL